jgi:hypothetical protein
MGQARTDSNVIRSLMRSRFDYSDVTDATRGISTERHIRNCRVGESGIGFAGFDWLVSGAAPLMGQASTHGFCNPQ